MVRKTCHKLGLFSEKFNVDQAHRVILDILITLVIKKLLDIANTFLGQARLSREEARALLKQFREDSDLLALLNSQVLVAHQVTNHSAHVF